MKPDWVIRVEFERNELAGRIDRLKSGIVLLDISTESKTLLEVQKIFMQGYLNILNKRLANWRDDNE